MVWCNGLFALTGMGRRKGARRLSRLLGPVDFQLGSQALVFFPQLVRLYVQFSHLPGLLLLSCFQFLAPEEELVFRGGIASHGAEFRRSCGMFGKAKDLQIGGSLGSGCT